MNKNAILLAASLLMLAIGLQVRAQSAPNPHAQARPKLVVGIVIDQMRFDLLYRFYDNYAERGAFKRMLHQGYSYANMHYNYIPTYTAPGHASIYTGTTPASHGIVSNEWYEPRLKRNVYCVEDSTVNNLGGSNEETGMSPRNLVATTITDQLRLAQNFAGKTIGIALKDRGAILPAGHTATGAFWFDRNNGNWITSTFYGQALPAWLAAFNNRRVADSLAALGWQPSLPPDQYKASSADDAPWEDRLSGMDKPTLPAKIVIKPATQKRGRYTDLLPTPAANQMTLLAAQAAFDAEKLGQGPATDFLAISFSAPDYCGHTFGPNSVEVQDMYIKLDRQLGDFMDMLEKKIGKDKVLFFLSADHGAATVPEYMRANKMPGGRVNYKKLQAKIDSVLDATFGAAAWVESYYGQELFLNPAALAQYKLNKTTVCDFIAQWVVNVEGVKRAVTLAEMETSTAPEAVARRNGYFEKRRGDLHIAYLPGWVDGSEDSRGTTHGSPYSYDTHVPMLWYGWRIQPGVCYRAVTIPDIAPTLASFLRIENPSACTGQPLVEVLERALGK
jgi:predicted AlkP superfamily pyrophosphatase or phosphodiesterase